MASTEDMVRELRALAELTGELAIEVDDDGQSEQLIEVSVRLRRLSRGEIPASV